MAAFPQHIFKLILIKVGAVYQTVDRKVRLLNLASLRLDRNSASCPYLNDVDRN